MTNNSAKLTRGHHPRKPVGRAGLAGGEEAGCSLLLKSSLTVSQQPEVFAEEMYLSTEPVDNAVDSARRMRLSLGNHCRFV
jgi:hypothetical protein